MKTEKTMVTFNLKSAQERADFKSACSRLPDAAMQRVLAKFARKVILSDKRNHRGTEDENHN